MTLIVLLLAVAALWELSSAVSEKISRQRGQSMFVLSLVALALLIAPVLLPTPRNTAEVLNFAFSIWTVTARSIFVVAAVAMICGCMLWKNGHQKDEN